MLVMLAIRHIRMRCVVVERFACVLVAVLMESVMVDPDHGVVSVLLVRCLKILVI